MKMRGIIIQELIRAGGVFLLLMWGLWYLQDRGVLALSTLGLLATGAGVSAVVFAVLVMVRTRTGKEFMLKRGRYLVILTFLVCVPVFIWRVLQGEVTRAVLFAIVVILVSLSFFIFRKKLEEKAGLKW
jgi:hypothetical protein